VPIDYEQMLVKNDFVWIGKNREPILAKWQERYASKSEPKPK